MLGKGLGPDLGVFNAVFIWNPDQTCRQSCHSNGMMDVWRCACRQQNGILSAGGGMWSRGGGFLYSPKMMIHVLIMQALEKKN